MTIALLDMYDSVPNRGMRCHIDIINRFSLLVSFNLYDVRGKSKLPEINQYDIYISTEAPGDSLVGDGNWDTKYYELIDALTKWNLENPIKKHVLFICHSFEMACKHFGLAEITKRNDASFVVMKMHKTVEGQTDSLF
jgi:homoserine O-succinyltransferase